MSDPGAIALPEASPRDRAVQALVLQLVEAYAFREAWEVLGARLAEIAARERTHLERLFLEWSDLPRETRPDFLDWAHHRRRPELARNG